jgi:TonB-dependent SusC/RagA subfamily outer membrane receptor
MRSILLSLLQIVLVSGILYSYYHFFLRNKRFHQYNRFFLLAAIAFSILIPFLNIPIYFTQHEANSSFVLRTLKLTPDDSPGEEFIGQIPIPEDTRSVDPYMLFYYSYIGLAVLFLVRILISLYKIRKLYRSNPVEKLSSGTDGDDIYFINTGEPGTPFSFFKWMFWNREIELQSDKGEQIFRHELFHIRQKHSWDIIFTELVTIIFWINPFFHVIKREIKAIHEFLADKYAANENGKWNYAELLLMQALNTNHSLVNPFFHTQIKRRIAMITSSNKPGHQYLRKILVLPLLALVAALFAFTYKATRNEDKTPDVLSNQPLVVVIDAGHGGIDPGARSADGKFLEASLTLELAQKIAELSSSYNIKVILTRNNEQMPGNATNVKDGLIKRVQISQENKADAFISLHLNAQVAGSAKLMSGFEGYVAKQTNGINSSVLGSTLLQHLAAIYTTNEQLKLRRDDIYVLEKNSAPSVVLQCGSISNPADLAFINDKSNQEQIAKAILMGLSAWANGKKANPAPVPSGIYTYSDTPRVKPFLRVHAKTIILKSGSGEAEEVDASEKISVLPDKLLIINGKKYTQQEAVQFKNATIKADEMIITPAGDKKAIELYGKPGANGVIEFRDAKIIPPAVIQKMEIEIQGVQQFQGKHPLYVIDGEVQIKTDSLVLKSLDPNSIESVTILKGESATALYGNDAKDGVIIIKTKSQLQFITVQGRKTEGKEQVISDSTEVITVTGYPTTKPQEEVTVTGYAKKRDDDKKKVDEVVVVGYGKKRDENKREEVTVVGKRIDKKSDEVVVTGYAKKRDDDKNKVDEVVVKGYQMKKDDDKKKLDEVVVVGYGTKQDNKIFEKVEIEATFPGGAMAFKRYLERNLMAGVAEENGAPAGVYTVFVQFVVHEDGSISDVKALTSHGYGMEQEAIRMIKKGPGWVPAIQNGHKVTSYRRQPIHFAVNRPVTKN